MKLKSLILIILFGLGIFNSENSLASSPSLLDRSDFQEHVATSYAIGLTSYLIYKNKLELTKEQSILASTITTLAIGYLRDQYLFKHDNLGDYMKANAAGVAAANLLTVTFEF